jgi:hypothetical protein
MSWNTICGDEFGVEFKGCIAIIVKAIYGLKTSAFAWRSHLAETLRDLGYTSCFADNDVWMRPNQKPNGFKYYEYVLIYTDDILSISHDPLDVLTKLDQHYILKKDSIGPPTQYLGTQVGNYQLPDDLSRKRWYLSSEKYVINVKDWMFQHSLIFKTKASSVLPSGYWPELDVTESCVTEEAEFYQQQIGVLQWAVELGRLDITGEVSMLAAYTAEPRIAHLKAALHIFAYLSQHDRSKLVLDDSYVKIDDKLEVDWSEFYLNAREDIPMNVPEPRRNEVQLIVFVDADHAR